MFLSAKGNLEQIGRRVFLHGVEAMLLWEGGCPWQFGSRQPFGAEYGACPRYYTSFWLELMTVGGGILSVLFLDQSRYFRPVTDIGTPKNRNVWMRLFSFVGMGAMPLYALY